MFTSKIAPPKKDRIAVRIKKQQIIRVGNRGTSPVLINVSRIGINRIIATMINSKDIVLKYFNGL